MVSQTVPCALCGLPTAYPISDEAGNAFCCPACREVSALLSGDGGETTAAVEVTEQARYESSETATLSLAGLWCTSCTWLIRETLRRAPGVDKVEVSAVQREARVTYSPSHTNPRSLTRLVRRLGYRAWLPGDKPYDEEDAHLTRLLISFVLVMHVMAISFMLYAREWTGRASPDTEWLADFFVIILLAASLPVMVILGLPILRAGVASLVRGRPNLHTLIAIGAFSAFGLSLRNLITGHGGVYFDTASILLFLVALGRWLEMKAQKASGRAIERLWDQVPPEVTWITADGEQQVSVDELPPGARIRVRPGERIPVDGVVAEGAGDVDESLLTGEPEPVLRRQGDKVLAGTMSLDGAFEVITTATGETTTVGQIGRLLHQAMWQKAPVERLADRLAAWLVPLAVLIAAATFVFWMPRVGPEIALLHALSVLLIACPCALGIATPLTLWLGLGRAAEAGVILRNTGVLERLDGVRRIYFDKTGTLTKRPLRVQAVAVIGMEDEDFLTRVAAVEALSEHPLAQAIVAQAKRPAGTQGWDKVTDFRLWPGEGVSGKLGQETWWVGNQHLMTAQNISSPPELDQQACSWQEQGLTVIYAGRDGHVIGLLGLGEEVRSEVPETIKRLKATGLQVEVLTGDDAAAGRRWQRWLNVPVHAEQLPQDKVARLRSANEPVAMVGDGINDSPALAAATVGLAVTQGTDVAQAAAEAILLHDDLRSVPWLIALSHLTMRKVRQNLAWAFIYNIIGLALAVSGQLQPVLAALAMVASSLIVTGNALRLKKAPITDETEPRPATPTNPQLAASYH